MSQLHRRFTDDQVKVLLDGYCQGLLKRAEVQEMLEVGKTRFFALVKKYRESPESFSLQYDRSSPGRLSPAVETAIERELLREKAIVDDKRLPISGYNYSALRDRLLKSDIKVSVNTIIARAKQLGCYKPRKKRKIHDREVLTASIGALVQHDSSIHLSSPFAEPKWDYWMKAEHFRRDWMWLDPMADQLGAMIYEQRWAELPVLLAKLAPHFRDITVKRMTRSESVWQGAYEKLMGG